MPASSPCSSTTAASIPGSGLPADPGLESWAPGRVVIMIWPVSVCHQVSTIGHSPPPITFQYQSHAFGLIGSPTVPSRRSFERSWRSGILRPPLDAGPDRGRRGVEDGHPELGAQSPPDVLVGVVGRALVHHRGDPVHQRPVDDVGVPGDPADVGRAPEDIRVGLQVEDVLGRPGDPGQIAAGGVQDPLRLRGRARRVEDVERVLGVERLRLALGARPPRSPRRSRGRGRRVISTSAPVLRTTTTVSIEGTWPRNSSTAGLIGRSCPCAGRRRR